MFGTGRIEDARKALGVYVTLNSVFGLWPLYEKNLLVKILWFVPTVEMVVMLMTSVYEMYFTCESASFRVSTLLVIISFGLVGLAKLIYYHAYRDSLRLNVASAIDDWFPVQSNHHLFHKRDTFVDVTICTDRQAERTVTILKKRFIFPSVCSFNNVLQTLYLLVNVHQFFQFLVCVGVNLSTDCFFITIAYHLCGEFEVLKRRFASFEGLKSETPTRREYGLLVGRHGHLLKLTKDLERSLNMIVLSQIIVNIILFDIAGVIFLIHLKMKERYSAVSPFGILVFTLVQTFVYADVGDNVSSVIEEVTGSIYDGPWRTMSTSMAKYVIFLMTLSNTSIHLTAGKLFRMKRSTLTQFFKTSVSYLSVFYPLIED